MGSFRKHGARRQSIRESRPDKQSRVWAEMRATGAMTSISIAVMFFLVAVGILWMRDETVTYRPGQYAPNDIVARVKFSLSDKRKLNDKRNAAREAEPHVYTQTEDLLAKVEDHLLSLPSRVAKQREGELSPMLRDVLDAVQNGSTIVIERYNKSVGVLLPIE